MGLYGSETIKTLLRLQFSSNKSQIYDKEGSQEEKLYGCFGDLPK